MGNATRFFYDGSSKRPFHRIDEEIRLEEGTHSVLPLAFSLQAVIDQLKELPFFRQGQVVFETLVKIDAAILPVKKWQMQSFPPLQPTKEGLLDLPSLTDEELQAISERLLPLRVDHVVKVLPISGLHADVTQPR